MKNLLTTAFLFLTILTASATSNDATIRNEASDITRRLANQIQLNESEYIQVKNFTVEKLTAVADIKAMYTNDMEMMFRKLNETEKAYNHKITSLLNAKQLDNYLAIHKSLKVNYGIIANSQE